MASSQFIPEIKIGYLYTYWGPLVSIITIVLDKNISLKCLEIYMLLSFAGFKYLYSIEKRIKLTFVKI